MNFFNFIADSPQSCPARKILRKESCGLRRSDIANATAVTVYFSVKVRRREREREASEGETERKRTHFSPSVAKLRWFEVQVRTYYEHPRKVKETGKRDRNLIPSRKCLNRHFPSSIVARARCEYFNTPDFQLRNRREGREIAIFHGATQFCRATSSSISSGKLEATRVNVRWARELGLRILENVHVSISYTRCKRRSSFIQWANIIKIYLTRRVFELGNWDPNKTCIVCRVHRILGVADQPFNNN